MWNWWNSIISGEVPLEVNSSAAALVEKSILEKKGKLSSRGSLVIHTGKYTGRSATDKYIVSDSYSNKVVDWKGSQKLSASIFYQLKEDFLRNVNFFKPHTYIVEKSACADRRFSLGLRFLTVSAPHALFCRTIFRHHLPEPALGSFTIYHHPDLDFNWKEYGLKSPSVIAISFDTKEIIIFGTAYSGEIKKAVFTVLSTLLPDLGVLPMHAGANINSEGDVSLFFGLSGTGKTTLATDQEMKLIGDDEIGLSDQGVFNFEGGCYAKTYGLTEKSEPQIFKLANHFGSLLENVSLDMKSRDPDYSDKTLTENARATYSIADLDQYVQEGLAEVPQNVFFLSADANGVLPAVSLLDKDQAIYYFLSGYTAKLAGTEMGGRDIRITFSKCFGAPFMIRRAEDYSELFKKFLASKDISIWLLNTGRYGGGQGLGKRYPIQFTRKCVRAIQSGQVEKMDFHREPIFNLQIPSEIKGVESYMLNPMELWTNQGDYLRVADDLKEKLENNFQRFQKKQEVDSHLL
jgi:phosphoenolpyruvate carboxykinase (ATP)